MQEKNEFYLYNIWYFIQIAVTFTLGEVRLHLRKTQIYLVFRSVCTNFAPKNRKYGKKKMALQGRATAYGAG